MFNFPHTVLLVRMVLNVPSLGAMLNDTLQHLQCVCSACVPPQRKGICDPPSKTFYDGTLSPADSVKKLKILSVIIAASE